MSVDASNIQREISQYLDPQSLATMQVSIAHLAELLARFGDKVISQDELRSQIHQDTTLVALSSLLENYPISMGNAVVQFGSNSQTGSVSIRDIAGANIINININFPFDKQDCNTTSQSNNSPTTGVPKYFVYLSKTKIDMLYEQFYPNIDTITTHPTTITKLKAIESHISSQFQVGSLMEPSSYIKFTARMKWGVVKTKSRNTGFLGIFRHSQSIAYFGLSNDHQFVFLGGSVHHLLDSNKHFAEIKEGDKKNLSLSFPVYLLQFISGKLSKDQEILGLGRHELLSIAEITTELNKERTGSKKSSLIESEVEIFARIFATHEEIFRNEKYQCIFGSPIYVSMAEI